MLKERLPILKAYGRHIGPAISNFNFSTSNSLSVTSPKMPNQPKSPICQKKPENKMGLKGLNCILRPKVGSKFRLDKYRSAKNCPTFSRKFSRTGAKVLLLTFPAGDASREALATQCGYVLFTSRAHRATFRLPCKRKCRIDFLEMRSRNITELFLVPARGFAEVVPLFVSIAWRLDD